MGFVECLARAGLAAGPAFGAANSFVRVSGYWVYLFSWIDDITQTTLLENAPQSPLIVHDAAAVLARLHAVGSENWDLSLPPTSASPFSLTPQAWLRHAGELWRRARLECASRKGDEHALAVLSDGEEMASKVIAGNSSFFDASPGDRRIVHGDFRPGNLARRDGRLCVFDFDLVSRNRVAVDVAYAALSFAGVGWFSRTPDWATYDLFASAYRKQSGEQLREDELRLATIFCALRSLSTSFKPSQVLPRWNLLKDVYQRFA